MNHLLSFAIVAGFALFVSYLGRKVWKDDKDLEKKETDDKFWTDPNDDLFV